VVESQKLGVVVDLSGVVLRQAVLLAHGPGLEDTSRESAVEALVVVIVVTGESVVDILDLVKSVVQAELSLEDGKSVAERRALLLRAGSAVTDILALARLAGLLARLAARLLALVDAGRNTWVASLVTEIAADIDLNGVRGVAAIADLLLVALAVLLLGLARGSQRNAALVILADALALLDALVVLRDASVVAIGLLAFALTALGAGSAAGLLRGVLGGVSLLGLAFSALGTGSAAGLLGGVLVTTLSTSLARSVAFLGSESSSVLVSHGRSRSVFGILSSVVDSLRGAVRFAGTALLLAVNIVVGTASLVAVDSDVLKQPRVGNVFSVAGLEQVLEELVDRVLRVAREAGRSRSVLDVLGSHELSVLGEQSITSVHKLIEVVIEISESTGHDVITTVLVLVKPADNLVNLTLLATHTFDAQRETTEADVDVDESSAFILEEQNERVDAGDLLGLRAEVKRLFDESQNATVVVGIVLIDVGVLVHLVQSRVLLRSSSHWLKIIGVVQAVDLAAGKKRLSESNTVRAETGEVVQVADGLELFGLKSGVGGVVESGKSVGDGLHTAEFLEQVRDYTLVDILDV
jgi:hypothetical protein